jgi:GNAT superfamily N-acetyltransferase
MNREMIRSLKYPICPDSFPAGGITPLESIINGVTPFRAVCPVCGNIYSPRFKDIKRGISITDGCVNSSISKMNNDVNEFLTSLGVQTKTEYVLGQRRYDIFVPARNTLIELNGLHWHSFPGSKNKDISKYKHAVSGQHGFIMIYEDEWVRNRTKVKEFLKNRFYALVSRSIRPHSCSIRLISFQAADSFYDRFHYIGPCRPRVSYGAFLEDRLVACMSFSHPTRQSRHPWELVRMASDSEYRVHGIWSKLLKEFCREYQPNSIVSFSDNRLFTGAVYEKIGFRYDGEVPPDYYWTKGNRRFHKSALRKRGSERTSGLTERELREAQGYRKIWDLGKKRWVLDVSLWVCPKSGS